MKIPTATRSDVAQVLLDKMAAGTTNPNPVIEVYAGSVPATMGQTIVDTLLGTLTLTATVGTVTDGELTFDTITDDAAADDSGTAGWCRVLNRDSEEAAYFTIKDDGSGEINFNSADIVAGAPIAISSLSVVIGGA